MRWDKLLEGAIFSGIVSVCTLGVPLFVDGKITGAEGVMALGFFVSGVGFYLREHKTEWNGVERREQSEPEKK